MSDPVNKEIEMQSNWLKWWDETGSKLRPFPWEDQEEHARRVSFVAWRAAVKSTEE